MRQKHIPLLAEIEAFLAEHEMAPTTFGLHAASDAKLVANLRNGADVRTRTADRIRAWMHNYPLARRHKRVA